MYNKYIQREKFDSDLLLLEILITELNELIKPLKRWKTW